MSQHYSDPSREENPYALPDVEVFYMSAEDFGTSTDDTWMAERMQTAEPQELSGWYYWFCFPGCLPDSEPNGPFNTKAEAIADAQEASE